MARRKKKRSESYFGSMSDAQFIDYTGKFKTFQEFQNSLKEKIDRRQRYIEKMKEGENAEQDFTR